MFSKFQLKFLTACGFPPPPPRPPPSSLSLFPDKKFPCGGSKFGDKDIYEVDGTWSIQSKKLNENINRDHIKRFPLYHLIIICLSQQRTF